MVQNDDNSLYDVTRNIQTYLRNLFTGEITWVSMSDKTRPFPWMPVIFLTAIFYLNFTSRVILAPLLPVIENDLGIGHGEAGSFFLYMACGSGVGLVGSGFVSSRLTHRKIIWLGIIMVGTALSAISISGSLALMRAGLVFAGICPGSMCPGPSPP